MDGAGMDDKVKRPEEPGRKEDSPELMTKEEFLKRFGVYALGVPVTIIALMTPRISRAVGSDGGPP